MTLALKRQIGLLLLLLFILPLVAPQLPFTTTGSNSSGLVGTAHASGTTDTIGGTAGNADGRGGNIFGSPITSSASGSLTSLGLNVKTVDGNLRLAIYSGYDGENKKFTGLLGQSASTVAIADWNDLSVTGVSIVASTTYYICFQVDSETLAVYYSTGSATYYGAMSYGSFVDPSVALTTTTSNYNMRMTYSNALTVVSTVSDIFVVNWDNFVNVTVTDTDGRTDIANVTIQVYTAGDAQNFILLWDQATNTFSEYSDPSGIVTINAAGSSNATYSTNGWVVNFYFKFTTGFTSGLCRVVSTVMNPSSSAQVNNTDLFNVGNVNRVFVTFDDGYLSQYTNATSVMNSYSITATFYLSYDLQGTWDRMSWSQVATLVSEGYEMGSHTRTHADLNHVSASQLADETAIVKNDFLTNHNVVTLIFAYPGGTGYNNATVTSAVTSAGYLYARTTQGGTWSRSSGTKTSVNGVGVTRDMDLPTWKWWVNNAYDDTEVVLYYHQIDQAGEVGVTLGNFTDQMAYLHNKGFTTLPMSQVGSGIPITFLQTGISSGTTGTVLTLNATAYTLTQFPIGLLCNSGNEQTVAASTPISVSAGKQYAFLSWTNGDGLSGASGTYTTPSSAATVTVNYNLQWAVNFTSSGIAGDTSGTVVTVGGAAKTQALLPFTSWVDDTTGSVAYAYSSPVSATAGKQYVWSSTSGCSVNTQSGTVSSVTGSCLVTGTYGIQYYFQVTDAQDSATGQGWYDDGASVDSTVARPSGGYDTTGWTGTGSLTSGGSAGSSTTGSFVIHAASTCVWNWAGTITIADLKITTVSGSSNLTATDPYTYYEFQVNVTDTGTMNNAQNVTIRVEQNPSTAIESDTPGYVEESKYWFRYDNQTNSWEWYNGSAWTGTSNWLDAANCSKPSSSATQGYFKFKIRLSKIAAKGTNWDFDAIAHDLQIEATATKKFDAFTVNTYSEYSLSTSEITWNVNPGDVNVTATSTLTITVTSNTVVKIRIEGSGDLTRVGGGGTIPLANVVVDDDSDPGTDARCLKLTQSYQDWWISIPAGANQEFTMYWFLSVPSPSATGTYVFTFYITVSE